MNIETDGRKQKKNSLKKMGETSILSICMEINKEMKER